MKCNSNYTSCEFVIYNAVENIVVFLEKRITKQKGGMSMSVKGEVTEAVFRDVSKCFNKNIEDLSLDTRLIEDLGAKSVNFIQVASFLEEEFGLTITYMDLRRQNTVGAIIEYLVKRVG